MSAGDPNQPSRFTEVLRNIAKDAGLIGLVFGLLGSEITISSLTGFLLKLRNPELSGDTLAVILDVCLKTTPMTVGVAIIVVAFKQGIMQPSFGSVTVSSFILVGAAFIGNYIDLGIIRVDISLRGGDPLTILVYVVGDYLRSYEPVLFVESLALGIFLSKWFLELASMDEGQQ